MAPGQGRMLIGVRDHRSCCSVLPVTTIAPVAVGGSVAMRASQRRTQSRQLLTGATPVMAVAVCFAGRATCSRSSRQRAMSRLCTQHGDDGSLVQYDRAVGRLVAKRDIEQGEVMLHEHPLILVDDLSGKVLDGDSDNTAWIQDRFLRAVSVFADMKQVVREQIMDLFCPDHSPMVLQDCELDLKDDELQFLRILSVCGLSVAEDKTGLYRMAVRANHSCRPNAWNIVEDSGELRMVALRRLSAAEEVTISYLPHEDLLRPGRWRRDKLSVTWDFQCGCPRCTGADDTRSLCCPSCVHSGHYSGDGPRGRVVLTSRVLMLGQAVTEITRWSACSTCGAEHFADDLLDSEEAWIDKFRGLPSDCQRPAVLRSRRSRQAALSDEANQMYDRAGLQALCDVDAELFSAASEMLEDAVPAPEAHWLSARLAAAAAEAHLLLGQPTKAIDAAHRWQNFVRHAMGNNVVAAEGCRAMATEACALMQLGQIQEAEQLWRAARDDANLLGLEDDELVLIPQLPPSSL